jgi:hypothetical protein
VTYLDDLSRELARRGIRGRLRRRILAEADDHLRSDAEAQRRFGSAGEVANAFAAELGTQASRRAAVGAFVALGVAGSVYAAAFVSLQFAGSPTETLAPALGSLSLAVGVVAPRVAFVAGTLALVRVLRSRGRVLPKKELLVIRRRTGIALGFGLATMGSLALYAHEFGPQLAGWWTSLTFALTALASTLLGVAAVPATRAARLRPRLAGDAGDVFDDLGVERFRSDPWSFARRVALLVGLAVWLESRRATRSTERFAVSSRDSPVLAASRRSGGTSGFVASIGACLSPHRSGISRT